MHTGEGDMTPKVEIADPIFYVREPPRPQSFPTLEELSQELDDILHDENQSDLEGDMRTLLTLQLMSLLFELSNK